jgi:SAM-dependent methyltransferase
MSDRDDSSSPDTGREAISAPAGRLYKSLVKLVEGYFETHGDSHQGLGCPRPDGFYERYRVYLDVIRFDPSAGGKKSLLDIGCGTGRLLDEIKASGRSDIDYRGVDLSPALLEVAKKKHPQFEFICGDPFDLDQIWLTAPDYVIFGGIFTCRLQMSEEQMTDYMVRMLRLAFTHCRRGVVFNVMSAHVDWTRKDLFHVPFDRMAEILQANFSRHYIFRANYGLYEYTVYLYRDASA